MVCDGRGELLVCDFPRCRKVFHKCCAWPGSAQTENETDAEGSRWICPRHRCAVCGVAETDPGQAGAQAVALQKCTRCTISLCARHRTLEASNCSNSSNSGGEFRCPHCNAPPARVRLARTLQETWAKMANHYLALPFMRPLLSGHGATNGAALDGLQPQGGPAHDLLGILEKVRRLEYGSDVDFMADVQHVHDLCRARVSGSILPDAWKTLMIIADKALLRHASTLRDLRAQIGSDPAGHRGCTDAFACPLGLQGLRPSTNLPAMTPHRSLKEWQTYVLRAPAQPGRDDAVNGASDSFVESYQERSSTSSSSSSSSAELPMPGTIADLLLELSNSAPAAHALRPPPFVERQDPFDSLPHHEVNDMFATQAKMLRSVLASNTKLREEWLRSKEKLMLSPATGEENAITLGEAHVLVELQVANQNLKAQLEQSRMQLAERDCKYAELQTGFAELQRKCELLQAQLDHG